MNDLITLAGNVSEANAKAIKAKDLVGEYEASIASLNRRIIKRREEAALAEQELASAKQTFESAAAKMQPAKAK